mmetsp:Transcript_62231/g.103401  ORF Transcript_62231/g.103401 Transcript_62231/m.103401 type:complete len:537 (-) Transcript_62231:301-1911(-)|eukprot:CAMPEP_0119315494 /NCGR_PEP_ID=MMETSP1333-20130426/36117_1 /TAXON_ID=418940 /ORGANISM="Scyphosphaera apsteinii, Strain RCC1455" /LENGTH=536 /DNA_ID=CAMNT_0007320875 /DNA_START=162 /DNA_END=1772 /DNA_ORIENTATION=+
MARLADEIALLLNPQPVEPGEEETDGFITAAQRSANLLTEDDRCQSAVGHSGRQRLRAAIDLGAVGFKYAGRRTSRECLQSTSAIPRQLASSKVLTRTSRENGYAEDVCHGLKIEDEGEDKDSSWDESKGIDKEEGEKGQDEGEDEEDYEEAEVDNGDMSSEGIETDQAAERDGDGSASLFEKWSEMQSQESELISQLRASRDDQLVQAAQARMQHTLWLQLLQLRIKLQPAMACASRWPAVSMPTLWGSTAPLRKGGQEAAAAIAELLDELSELRRATLRSYGHGVCDGEMSNGGTKQARAERRICGTNTEEWWACLSKVECEMQPLIESWVDESAAMVQDGGTLHTGRQFKTIRQGVLQQVEHIMSQLPVGSRQRAERCHKQTAAVLGMAAGSGQADSNAPAGAAALELYDDAEFYHSLLRELLEDGSTELPASTAMRLKHKKRKTDNRRSKGRTLSYEVQPQLQNFMFPVIPERPIILSELFSSVFGQRPVTWAEAPAATSCIRAKRARTHAHESEIYDAREIVLHPNLFLKT